MEEESLAQPEEGPGDGARGLEQALGPLLGAGGIAGASGRRSETALPAGSLRSPNHPQTSCHVWGHAWARGRGKGWRCVLAGGAMGSIRGPSPGDGWPKVPYVLLKDTAMVSTAFSNSRLSVSLLDS